MPVGWLESFYNELIRQTKFSNLSTKLMTQFIIAHPAHDHRRMSQLMTVCGEVKRRTAARGPAGSKSQRISPIPTMGLCIDVQFLV